MRTRSLTVLSLALTSLLCLALVGGCGGDGNSDKDFCQNSCAAVVAAACTNGPTNMEDCLAGCAVAQSTCPSEFSALAGCAGDNPTFSCDFYDSPAPPSCASQNAALQSCLMGIDSFCYLACPAVVDPGCSNGPTDAADCLTGCNEAATNCPTEFAALAQCAGANATFSCDLDDSPAPDGCETENATLNTCLEQ